MDKINVGDLVMVTKGMICCGHITGTEGMVFIVSNIFLLDDSNCNFCNANLTGYGVSGCPGKLPIDLPRLIKFKPFEQLIDNNIYSTRYDDPSIG